MRKTRLIAGLMLVLFLAACAGGMRGAASDELPTSSDLTANQKRAQNHLNLAISYYQQRQWDSALEGIKQALQLDSNMADAYGVRALIYMEMGETNLAEENFQHAISIVPNSPDYSNNYGWFLCQNGHEAQSIPHFETAIKNRNYQGTTKALNNAGTCSLKMKNEAVAERYFSQAFQLDPANPVANANLAKIYYDRKDYERARFYVGRIPQADELNADVLWLAIKVNHKLGDRDAETSLVTQLRKRHINSPEYAAFRRGAFDE